MEFIATFMATEDLIFSVNIPAHEIGVLGVKQIRTYLVDINFPLSRINGDVEAYYSNQEIIISERIALESKLFNYKNAITINVRGGFLNNYVSLKPYCNSKEAGLKLELNEEKVIKEWKANGFPLKWR